MRRDRVGPTPVPVSYRQFRQGWPLRASRAVLGVLSWPLTIPLALISRVSDLVFRACSEALSGVPYLIGEIFRYEFYRASLPKCGRNVFIGYGTVFVYRDVVIGDNVLIGLYNTIHHCDFGSYVLVADGCRFLSGSRYHGIARVDLPMALQDGSLRRIRVADDCWIGANAIVMNDVGSGVVVGAGAVVVDPVPERAIVVGNPARIVRIRE